MGLDGEKNGFRYVFITQEDPFYVRVFFEEFFRLESRLDEVSAVVIAPAMGKRSMAGLARQMWGFYGPTDFARMATRFVAYKVKTRLGLGRPGHFHSIEQCCRHYGVPVIHAPDLNAEAFLRQLASINPDLAVSVAAPQIFRKPLITLPRLGCINIHNSPLPRYRGMLPNFWQMFHGENAAGTTIHRINAAVDEGAILMRSSTPILPEDSLDDLIVKTKAAGARLMQEAITGMREGTLKDQENRKSEGSYFTFPKPGEVREFRKKGYRLL